MPDLVIAGSVFHSVPQIDVPVDGGGTASFFSTADATAAAADIASGKTAYGPAGKITGTGGIAPVTVEEKDVMFIDIDGTPLYSYTLEEAHNLASMPALPDHSGDEVPLSVGVWNYTLAQVKALTHPATIGAMFSTTDGKMHLLIDVPDYGDRKISMKFVLDSTSSVDWGDGTTEAGPSTQKAVTLTHTYAAAGHYDIAVQNIKDFASYAPFFGSDNQYAYARSMITHVRCYAGLPEISVQSWLAKCPNLETITLPRSYTISSRYCLSDCPSLRALILPRSMTSVPNYFCNNAASLKRLSIPATVASLGSNAFSTCSALERIDIPSSVTTVSTYAFYKHAVKHLHIPGTITTMTENYPFAASPFLNRLVVEEGITALPKYALYSSTALTSVELPSTLTSMDTYAFGSCSALVDFHIKATTPPTIQSNSIPSVAAMKIYVPQGTLATYQAAANWSTYASKMVEEPA